MMLISIDVDSLNKSTKGSITGIVYVQSKNISFPNNKWSDFPVVIIGWWLKEIVDVLNGTSQSGELQFMDGDYLIRVMLDKTSGDFSIKFVEQTPEGDIIHGKITSSRSVLVGNMLEVGHKLVEACHAKSWSNNDIVTLNAALDNLRGIEDE